MLKWLRRHIWGKSEAPPTPWLVRVHAHKLVAATLANRAIPGLPVEDVATIIMEKLDDRDLLDAWQKGRIAIAALLARRIDLAIQSWRQLDKQRA